MEKEGKLVKQPLIGRQFDRRNDLTVYTGRCETLLDSLRGKPIDLIVTSPPYNIGKRYGSKLETVSSLEDYRSSQGAIIRSCAKRLAPSGNLVWQLGSFVRNNELVPLDMLLYGEFIAAGLVLRNRIIWGFDHGLNSNSRLASRYETALWFSWPGSHFTFNLDAIRVPQKYPGKRHYKGPKKGELSGNPLGKNPGDRWTSDVWDIPNVKAQHVEKTDHPCQFPVELAERFVLALSNPGDLVFDPFMGVGSTLIAAHMHGRRGLGSEVVGAYAQTARRRIKQLIQGNLSVRPIGRAIPAASGILAQNQWSEAATVG